MKKIKEKFEFIPNEMLTDEDYIELFNKGLLGSNEYVCCRGEHIIRTRLDDLSFDEYIDIVFSSDN